MITQQQREMLWFWPHDTRAKWALFTLATDRWIAEERARASR